MSARATKPKPAPSVRALKRLSGQIADLEEAIRQFRRQHPPGHRCPACDILREEDARCGIVGPTDVLAATEVILWQCRHAIGETLL
ncbi:hypothetical protein J0H58_28340 [bacterium]|nr:hypothetical protein [bacterium]